MQADRSTTKQTQKYKSVANAFMTILRTEGWRDGLYKVRSNQRRRKKKTNKQSRKDNNVTIQGVETTVLRAAVLTGAQVCLVILIHLLPALSPPFPLYHLSSFLMLIVVGFV